MDKDTIRGQITALLEAEFGVIECNTGDEFEASYGFDEMDWLDLEIELEKMFPCDIPKDLSIRVTTVEDLVELLAICLGE